MLQNFNCSWTIDNCRYIKIVDGKCVIIYVQNSWCHFLHPRTNCIIFWRLLFEFMFYWTVYKWAFFTIQLYAPQNKENNEFIKVSISDEHKENSKSFLIINCWMMVLFAFQSSAFVLFFLKSNYTHSFYIELFTIAFHHILRLSCFKFWKHLYLQKS